MDNWKLVAQSVTKNAYINTIVSGIPTLFVRTEEGIFFTLAIPKDELPKVCSRTTALLLMKSRPIAGRTAIGRFNEREGRHPSGSWPLVDGDKDLIQYIEQSVKHLSGLVDNFRHWSSFNAFLKTEIEYDLKWMPVESQPPFEYWWLIGKTAPDRPVHKTPLYKDAGVFIRPGDNNLPVFTSSLYADMASQYYSQDYGIPLIPIRMPCPTCYLNGLGGFIGSEILKGALLNEQWRIRFFDCDEQAYSSPTHFYISDTDGEDYALVGCSDTGTSPHWAIRKWGHDEQWFPKKCHPLPWSITK